MGFIGPIILSLSLSTSYYSHEFTTSFIRLPQPTYALITSFYSCGPVGHSLLFLFHFLYIVGLLLLLGTLSKVGINKHYLVRFRSFNSENKKVVLCIDKHIKSYGGKTKSSITDTITLLCLGC